MWVAVIITLFLAGFIFHFLARYHHSIETKDWASVTSASSKSDDENANKVVRMLKQRLKPVRAYCKAKWRKMNRKKIFFKKYNARYAKRKHLLRSNFQRSLSLMISSNEEEPVLRGLYIFERLDNSILYTYGMFMNVSLPRVPTVWSIRMFTGWWWLYCILVSVAYKASMTAILASPAPR